MPYGNGKARANAWNLPDPMPVHREPIYTPRPRARGEVPDATGRRASSACRTSASRCRRRRSTKNIAEATSRSSSPPAASSNTRAAARRRARTRGWPSCSRTCSSRSTPADAAERGIKDGQWVWVYGAENGAKVKVKALVTDRVGQGVAFMPFHFSGWYQGEDMRAQLPAGHRPDRARRKRQHRHDLRLRPRDGHAGDRRPRSARSERREREA